MIDLVSIYIIYLLYSGKNPLQLDDFKLELEKRGIIQSYTIDTKIVTFVYIYIFIYIATRIKRNWMDE